MYIETDHVVVMRGLGITNRTCRRYLPTFSALAVALMNCVKAALR
jgi:hypothetical protein